MQTGYIKIWRKIQDSFIYQDSQALHLWIHLLLEANHKDKEFMFNGKKMICKRGQFVSGRKSLADKTGIEINKVYRLLEMFKNEQLIEQQKTNRFTLISIVCYEKYQSNEQQNEQQMNNKRTTDEQQMNTTNNDKNEKNVRSSTTPLKAASLPTDVFIEKIKTNPAYAGINIERELSKMDAWLMTRPGRSKTKRFIINWLNKIDRPIGEIGGKSDFEKFCEQEGVKV